MQIEMTRIRVPGEGAGGRCGNKIEAKYIVVEPRRSIEVPYDWADMARSHNTAGRRGMLRKSNAQDSTDDRSCCQKPFHFGRTACIRWHDFSFSRQTSSINSVSSSMP
jgi:hypothetical protein